MDSVRRVRLRASGDVQGVFFRSSARDRARELGLSGWVRNEPDGDVAVEAQGPAEAVQAFVDFCRAGPGQARVDALEVRDIDVVGGEGDFEVRH